jgi:hypothetical protein
VSGTSRMVSSRDRTLADIRIPLIREFADPVRINYVG